MTHPLTILVTGATSGIGRATALALAAKGHRVFASGRDAEALASLKDEGLHVLHLDVTDKQSIASAVEHIAKETDGVGLDVLVNNAGFGVLAPVLEITEEDLRRQFETNVFGLLAVTRAFTAAMIARRKGTVINVGSVGGRMTLPFLASYNATKYAVESISDGLRTELYPLGVRVSLVEPGVIATRFNATAMDRLGRYDRDDSPWAVPLRKMAQAVEKSEKFAAKPEAVARTIVALATAKRPPARVIAPWHAASSLWLTKLLPTTVVDFAMRSVVGLRAPAMAAALPAVPPSA